MAEMSSLGVTSKADYTNVFAGAVCFPETINDLAGVPEFQ